MDRLPSIGQSNSVRDVFISYSHTDVGPAQILAELLEANGLSVWWDRRLVPGDKFHTLIERELEMAKAVIVLWSSNSVKSDWVLGEAQTAHDMNKLIPVRISECKLPLPYRGIHTPEVYKSPDELDQLARLLTLKLRASISSESNPDGVKFSTGSSSNFLRNIVNQMELANAETDRINSDWVWYNPISWIIWWWRMVKSLCKNWKASLISFLIAWVLVAIVAGILSGAFGVKVGAEPIFVLFFVGSWAVGTIGWIVSKVQRFRAPQQRK